MHGGVLSVFSPYPTPHSVSTADQHDLSIASRTGTPNGTPVVPLVSVPGRWSFIRLACPCVSQKVETEMKSRRGARKQTRHITSESTLPATVIAVERD
jgi:hypothetical protein